MILFSSLFTLLFRLSLLVQGPVEEVSLDWSSLLGVESPVSSSLTGEHLETVHGSFNGIGTLVPSIEVEEKVEEKVAAQQEQQMQLDHKEQILQMVQELLLRLSQQLLVLKYLK